MDKKDHHANHKASQSRRKFLMRTGAGIVIASLPARSVWAGSGGIAQSIVASGHGSDFANGVPVKLQSPGYFMNSLTSQNHRRFVDVFGGAPFNRTGTPYSSLKSGHNATLGDILNSAGNGNGKLGGPGNINFHLVGIYLNAYFSALGEPAMYYPIIGHDKPFADDIAFATYLYQQALDQGPSIYGGALGQLIDHNHA
ncbi:hypothetical protein Q3O59_03530 [Alkalimonas delamerensis]|uniref:Uncharacterized protein n=1 Tax=Alkalimonas delamerensis TaxID=265981 RepID=A0ABT9GMT3_9GAMM|nr:hypothetical protein [Alkalimonas delamerensis]MDP4528100.1 hypothetical protein [Alkalimonas delamerensis]